MEKEKRSEVVAEPTAGERLGYVHLVWFSPRGRRRPVLASVYAVLAHAEERRDIFKVGGDFAVVESLPVLWESRDQIMARMEQEAAEIDAERLFGDGEGVR